MADESKTPQTGPVDVEAIRERLKAMQRPKIGTSAINAAVVNAHAYVRDVSALLAENRLLREALTWAVGYIRCNMPSAADYPDFRHAAALVADGKQIITGEFTLARFRAEQAEEENARLRADVGRLRAALPRIVGLMELSDRRAVAQQALAATAHHAPQ